MIKTELEWFTPEEKLPIIPEGRHAVHVLVIAHDPCYEECCPGKGSSVESATWMKGELDEHWFHVMLLSMGAQKTGSRFAGWAPHSEEITHWAYWPEAIQKGETNEKHSNCDIDCPGRDVCNCDNN